MSSFIERLKSRIVETTERFEKLAEKRERVEAHLKRGDIVSANGNNKQFIEERLKRAGGDASISRKLANAGTRGGNSRAIINTLDADKKSTIAYERILGQKDLISVNFLTDGAIASRAVARVNVRNSRKRNQAYGTGFMIAPNLMMTNNHVLASIAQAEHSLLEFNYEFDPLDQLQHPIQFELDPDRFFITNKKLDYSIVAVESNSHPKRKLSEYGWRPLRNLESAIGNGDRVNIIQHPGGEPKQLTVRQNMVMLVIPDQGFVHYTADTAPGSSGAPVFDDEWDIVALHHSGVPKTDSDDHVLAIGGDIWEPEMGPHRIDWIANEGVLVSTILADIKAKGAPEGMDSEQFAQIFSPPQPSTTPQPIIAGLPSVVASPETNTDTTTYDGGENSERDSTPTNGTYNQDRPGKCHPDDKPEEGCSDSNAMNDPLVTKTVATSSDGQTEIRIPLEIVISQDVNGNKNLVAQSVGSHLQSPKPAPVQHQPAGTPVASDEPGRLVRYS